jgi:hypothetical protein
VHDFLHSVCTAIQAGFGDRAHIIVEEASGTMSNDMAMPLALIANELLTNAVKHGFNGSGATAHSDLATKVKAQPANPLAWLSKPYTPGALVMAVRDALSGLGRATPNQA